MQEKQIIVISSVEDNSSMNITYKVITDNLLEHLNESNQRGKKETMDMVKRIVEAVTIYEHEIAKSNAFSQSIYPLKENKNEIYG